MTDRIDYNQLMQRAFKALLKDLLNDIGENGLPGEHHFYITFDTAHPGVDIAPWMKDKYPEEMTIVVQDWFENLAVMNDRFTINLNFSNVSEPMVIPFDALKTFVDPSVEFGLKFDPVPTKETEKPDEPEEKAKQADAEVVSLDSFRKP